MSLSVRLLVESPVKVGGAGGWTSSEERRPEVETNQVWHGAITHHLGRMAEAIGAYTTIWRPENAGIKKAIQMVVPLARAYYDAVEREAELRGLEPENKWATYDTFVGFVKDYLIACIGYPDAAIKVLR